MISSAIVITSVAAVGGVALCGGAVAYRWYKRRTTQPISSAKKMEAEAMVDAIMKTAANESPATPINRRSPDDNHDFTEMEEGYQANDIPIIDIEVCNKEHYNLDEKDTKLPREKNQSLTETTDSLPEAELIEISAADSPATDGTEEEENPKLFATDKFRSLVSSATDENLKLLLLDRLDEIDEEAPTLTRQALCAVTLLDEIREMESAYTEQNAEVLAELITGVTRHLAELECEVLDSDTWDATIQKIGRITYNLPPGAEPVITAKLASGLRVDGQIIRKQSIVLSKSSDAF